MRKGRNTADILENVDEPEDIELAEDLNQERTLILKAVPPSRKVQLLAHGVAEIRCVSCDRIKPLAGAEDTEQGWICEDCMWK